MKTDESNLNYEIHGQGKYNKKFNKNIFKFTFEIVMRKNNFYRKRKRLKLNFASCCIWQTD